MQRKSVRVTFIVVIGLLIILWIGLQWLSRSANEPLSEFTAYIYQPAPTPGGDLDAIESNAEIAIPTSASEIYAVISGFRDMITQMRFDLPSRDLPAFLENTYCVDEVVPTNSSSYTPGGNDPEWWQPHQATDLVRCVGGHDSLHQQILVDRSDSQMYTVYVISITGNFATPTFDPE